MKQIFIRYGGEPPDVFRELRERFEADQARFEKG